MSDPKPSPYTQGLDRNAANYVPLSPLSFIERSAYVYPDYLAIAHGPRNQTWKETYQRCRKLASGLQKLGVGKFDTVSVLLPNILEMVECHFGIPGTGGVINTINVRLDAATIAHILNHGEAKVLICDREFSGLASEALKLAKRPKLIVIDVDDPECDNPGKRIGSMDYEQLIASGDDDFMLVQPEDEWDAIALNYTSGTTGDPKGVVYHHRGAYVNALSNILDWGMPLHPIYLWTLPMFHCNGWCFPWTMAANAGVNVCLRRIDVQLMFDKIRRYGVTHYSAAPIVHSMLANAPESVRQGVNHKVQGTVAAAPPSAAMLEAMSKIGFEITHVYGLTETYGPAAVCAKHASWESLSIAEQAVLNSRQGVRYRCQEAINVLKIEDMSPVPWDGETIGEIVFRGNIVMKGYLKNPKTTEESFYGGWYHTGDLAVIEPDGYIKIKDRAKDIIISGGENISSVEVEDVLYKHPAVLTAAVVAAPDPKWGEVPCAFIELRENTSADEKEILEHCRKHLAGFKVPKKVIFADIPKTSTGKLQKYVLRKQMNSKASFEQ